LAYHFKALATVLLLGSTAAMAVQLTGAPTGARIERSGYATIERAPSVPYPADPPPSQYIGAEAEWYARDNGISVAEARKRQAEQNAMMGEFQILLETLRLKEPGNFTASRMVHQPDWGYEFYFKRDPQATLAKYTRNPRYSAKLARYTRDELEALIKPWTERFTAEKITGGWGTDETHGTAEIMMNVSEAEYRQIAAQKGWGPVPDAIKLGFAAAPVYPAIDPRARPYLRAFAAEDRSTVIQLLAAGQGRIVLKDGCLRIGTRKESPAVMFHRETGIGIDDQGYMVLTDRQTGKSQGRIGEWFSWGGPNNIPASEPDVIELQQRCGGVGLVNVGNPRSMALSRLERPHIVDEVARERRMSRKQAWTWLKKCWVRQEASTSNRPPDDYCRRS
jgi:hypothetical protein